MLEAQLQDDPACVPIILPENAGLPDVDTAWQETTGANKRTDAAAIPAATDFVPANRDAFHQEQKPLRQLASPVITDHADLSTSESDKNAQHILKADALTEPHQPASLPPSCRHCAEEFALPMPIDHLQSPSPKEKGSSSTEPPARVSEPAAHVWPHAAVPHQDMQSSAPDANRKAGPGSRSASHLAAAQTTKHAPPNVSMLQRRKRMELKDMPQWLAAGLHSRRSLVHVYFFRIQAPLLVNGVMSQNRTSPEKLLYCAYRPVVSDHHLCFSHKI